MSCFESMRGVLPSSMLDWPGKICTVLFLGGCNFRCPYCHNPELLQAGSVSGAVSWDDLSLYLRERSGWIDGVSITGGEPTIHDDLPLLCESLRGLGMAVKVDTNGSRPLMLTQILSRGMADFIAMDLKTSLHRYPMVARRPVEPQTIADSMHAVIHSGLEHEFRCTVVPGLVGFEDLESLARRAVGARLFVLQQFRSGSTLDPAFRGADGYPDDTLLEWAEQLSELVPTEVRGMVGASRG
jgi:pyruvate formate lyase activating enzyme